jgi:hypothetical protein
MPFVQRDERGFVVGRFANAQPGFAEEWLPDGSPDLAPRQPTRTVIEAQRLRAYADPITGSDRYFAEAQRESLLGNVEAAEAATSLGMARFAEIQAEYPWPAE